MFIHHPKKNLFSREHETVILSTNPLETHELARSFAGLLAPGDVVLLLGEVGTGKTTFTQALVAALGIDTKVTSPSFKLINEYRRPHMVVYHFDLYRLNSLEDIENLGWNEYMYSDGISIVEWAEHARNIWPSKHWELVFTHVDQTTRELRFRYQEKV